MHRIPLVLGAEPRKFSNSARVRLLAGKWTIKLENIKDSILMVHLDTTDQPITLIPGNTHELVGPCIAQVVIHKAGTESFIAVFAELQ